MGEQYKAILQAKLRTYGARTPVSVYIDDGSLSPHYRKHLEETVLEAGATLASRRADANVIFAPEAIPSDRAGALIASIVDGQLRFSGGLALTSS